MREAKGDLQVPDALVREARWVGWKPVKRRDKWTKMPIRADGRPASSTNRETWGTLAEVRKFSGRVGFVVGGGIGCVDLDDVIDERGRLSDSARWLLRDLPATWVEVSPSGRGLHVWGLVPEMRGRVRTVGGVSVEVYSRDRFITVTGVPFESVDVFGVPVVSPLKLADLSEFLGLVS